LIVVIGVLFVQADLRGLLPAGLATSTLIWNRRTARRYVSADNAANNADVPFHKTRVTQRRIIGNKHNKQKK